MSKHFIEPNGITVHVLRDGITVAEAVTYFAARGMRITGRLLAVGPNTAEFLSPIAAPAAVKTPSTTTTH